jgi:hypothetical protein
MRILSIDIGIKNLSFCYLDVTNKQNYNIILWDIINLLNEEQKICSREIINKKQNKKCNNKATYTILSEHFCKKHIGNKEICCKEYLHILKTGKISQKIYKQLKNEFELNNYDKNNHNIILEIIKNKIKEKYAIPINKLKSANDIDLIEIGINIKLKLDKIFLEKPIDIILIENQISTLATRMKTIQGMIAQYFINNNKINIKFISSKNKLKDYDVSKKTYNERKKSSIEITNKLLSENLDINIYKEFFSKNKKKDDLADCFLQGLWYINNK